MDNTKKVFSIMMLVLVLLTGCSSSSKVQTGFSKIEPTLDQSSVGSITASDETSAPFMSWEQKMQKGKLIYTIDDVHVFRNTSAIGSGGYGEHSEIIMHDEKYYQQAQDNWKEYGSLYEKIYPYPEYIDSNGNFIEGAYMIALDLTVKNKDATNELKNSKNELEARYGNPYLFKVDSILYLIDREVTDQEGAYIGRSCGFFSGYGAYKEHPFAYELKPDEEISFRIGYLIGNRPDGSASDFKDFVVSTSSYALDDGAVWFDLNLEEVQ